MTKKAITFGPKTAQKLYALLGGGSGYAQNPLSSSMMAPEDWPRVFRNDSAETIPAYACCRVTGVVFADNLYVVVVNKPNSSGGPFVFNGCREVEVGGQGTFQKAGVVRAKSSGSVSCGECWGPLSDWHVEAGGDVALTVFGSPESNIAIGATLPDSECVESASDSSGSSFLCTTIPGVDLDMVEEFPANDVDFVLAIKNGCLVKVAVSDCAGSGSV